MAQLAMWTNFTVDEMLVDQLDWTNFGRDGVAESGSGRVVRGRVVYESSGGGG